MNESESLSVIDAGLTVLRYRLSLSATPTPPIERVYAVPEVIMSPTPKQEYGALLTVVCANAATDANITDKDAEIILL